MRFDLFLILSSLAILAGPAVGLGLFRGSRYMRELQLAAELNLDPRSLSKKNTVHSVLAKANTQVEKVTTEYITIPIDHNDTSVGTYQNRFWVNDDYYEAGRPIIMYDAGETNAESIARNHLTSSLSFFRKILEDTHAMGIIWEHRYYGNSTPFPISRDTPPEHFKYLTTKQALEDIPYFARNFSRPKFAEHDLTPSSTPWVLVGGSYAGIRAAFARHEYPDVIFAAYSSSAPVQAQLNMSIYYDQVYRGLVGHGFENCAKDIHAALGYIDQQLSNNHTAAAIKKLFFGPGADQNSNEGFTAALATIYSYFQNYGLDGPEGTLRELCEYLEVDPTTKEAAGPEGFAPVRGSKHVAERWAAWPAFTPLVNNFMETNCRGLSDPAKPSCKLDMTYYDPDSISWSWQYCTEWGFYQSNNFGPYSLLSRYQTLEYQQEVCNNQFALAVANGMLPSYPQTEALNKEYGGWNIRPSNTFFTGGEFDPWRTLSMLTTEDIAPEVAPDGITFSNKIPNCGETSEDKVFGYLLKDSEHCYDFQGLSTEGKAARDLFEEALTKWLPCFRPSSPKASKVNVTQAEITKGAVMWGKREGYQMWSG
ncbi:serine carboxypeptidase S28-domain-containing protein [Aspergillus sergii]|uniref:Serine carboxypeptidase S28-domain-containing protein n=1 Tax=Aspergillus sergii TaxID=1034303 RepID=A0A5N6WQX7_9EURO|nr:serine carboxypeptidase S28-domain-containing protein [Aspergillus sergii]